MRYRVIASARDYSISNTVVSSEALEDPDSRLKQGTGQQMGSEFSKRLLSSWKHDSEKYAGNFSEVAIHPCWAEKAEIVEYVPRETVMLRPQANLEFWTDILP